MRISMFLFFAVMVSFSGLTQQTKSFDKAVYVDAQPGFYQDSIMTYLDGESAVTKTGGRYLAVDFTNITIPSNIADYKQYSHQKPVSQGSTGTCWSYAALSLMESEAFRIAQKEVKLSEMYVVYWEYVARAEYFVEKRGKMNLGEGSASNAVTRVMKKHGIVPESVYTGKPKGQRFHDHRKMFEEIRVYLNSIAKDNNWNTEQTVSTVKSILNHYMGEPPLDFSYDGKTFTPLSFMNDYLKIRPDDYFSFMSTKSKPYNQKGKFEHPDNWWGSTEYYNVNLNDFVLVMKDALENGYTFSICGDVSEPGYDRYTEAGMIPTFDIPVDYINEDAREFRMYNKSTTDDHCIHFVGFNNRDGIWWFLIKDSGSGGFDGPNKGYRFIREDFAKLKVMAVMVHKAGAKKVLDKIIK